MVSRIVLVEDHPVVRIGMRKILDDFPYVDVIAECETVHDTVTTCRRLTPDLVILPLRIEGEQHGGIELCRMLREVTPSPRLLVYTSFASERDVTGAYLSGADSYLHKAATPKRLGEAIRLTVDGHRVWEIVEHDADEVAAASATSLLTARETEVLALMLQRRTNREIAEQLVVTLPTVKTHVRNVLRKLGASSRRHLHEQMP